MTDIVEVPLMVGDTECLVRISDTSVLVVVALDGGGPGGGPRKISLNRQMLDDIRTYLKELTSEIAGQSDQGVRSDVPTTQVGDI